MNQLKSEIRDGMQIDWDAPIEMEDGLILRADIFRPIADGKYPAILSYGPYGKGLPFQEGYKTAWDLMSRDNPDALAGSSNKYQNWEVVDPENGFQMDMFVFVLTLEVQADLQGTCLTTMVAKQKICICL